MKLRLKPIPGFESLYAGSDGTIWRYRKFSGYGSRWNGWRTLALQVHRDGYLEVHLPQAERSNKHMMVHTLVALAFHGERPQGLVITHLDGDKRNNAPSNLAYRTHRDNVLDKVTHGTMVRGEAHYRSKLTDAQAQDILSRLRAGEYATTLASEFGVHVQTVYGLKSGRVRAHLSQPLH